MASVNKVILVGRLGKEPELKTTTNGNSVGKFSLATTDYSGSGESRQEVTDWHNIVCYGKAADNVGQYTKKGSQVYIEGRIKNRSYDDKNGQKRYITEIIADRIQFLDSRPKSQSGSAQDFFEGFPVDDDVPF